MSGLRSRRKGKRGEYIARDLLREFEFEARRGIQAAGEADITHSIDGVHLEVKNDEALSIWAMLGQAENDAKPGEVPVVFFKRNGTKMYAALDAREYLKRERRYQIVEEFLTLVKGEPK